MEASSIGAYVFPSELGWMAVTWTNDRLTRLTFGHPSAAAAAADLRLADDAAVNRENDLPGWVADLVDGLQNYAAGGDVSFDNVPLSLDHLSEFQRRVVKACRRIGRGRVRTYGELAAASGSPAAARAAGNVMAQNRYPIIVPCHRVVGSAGSLGGFSARDGISMKWRMLELEGAELKPARLRKPRPMARA
jgi:methylated-DNA-[protein]-cysteine S-methyltransferase